MSLDDWAKAGWLKAHQTTRQQITDLFGIVDRDLEDAARGLAVCTIATVAIRVCHE